MNGGSSWNVPGQQAERRQNPPLTHLLAHARGCTRLGARSVRRRRQRHLFRQRVPNCFPPGLVGRAYKYPHICFLCIPAANSIQTLVFVCLHWHKHLLSCLLVSLSPPGSPHPSPLQPTFRRKQGLTTPLPITCACVHVCACICVCLCLYSLAWKRVPSQHVPHLILLPRAVTECTGCCSVTIRVLVFMNPLVPFSTPAMTYSLLGAQFKCCLAFPKGRRLETLGLKVPLGSCALPLTVCVGKLNPRRVTGPVLAQ